MLRNEWKFDYAAAKLGEAAAAKLRHHQQRLLWWRGKKDEVVHTIRAEGLEIEEKQVLEYASPKSRDWNRGTQVTVRDDLRTRPDECLQKLAWHTEKCAAYGGWVQVLAANPEVRVPLDHEDWLFFFGEGA